ncbi:solute carrier family 40 member 2, chloroplastic-like isoform X3 [Musa acuminata AAA Group]|uniref:solute carrier family 40 member 2, chloroplastic-like isoform X3 n=1 Tax=Musa acuminata AAA Group TaxID=214697 RepID=UPI0031DA646A
MRLFSVSVRPSAPSSLLRFTPLYLSRRRILSLHPLRPPGLAARCRLGSFTSQCYVANSEVDFTDVATNDVAMGDPSPLPSSCSTPFVHLSSDILSSELQFLTEETYKTGLLTTLPVLSKEEQDALAATPVHPAGLVGFKSELFVPMQVLNKYSLVSIGDGISCSFLAGNLSEHVWNFTWPAAVAMLHPSLLPVAVVSFFSKFAILGGGPLIGIFMDSLPRIPSYHCLNLIQTVGQLLSAAMIMYALDTVRHSSVSSLLLQPWFLVLLAATATERLASLALGVTMERDWIVLLAGTNRPIALAQANAINSRVDLLCEIVLGQLINRLSSGVLDRSMSPQTCDKPLTAFTLLDLRKIVEIGLTAIRYGWMEYKHQPVLPASVAYVLLCLNIALAPGAMMTAFLIHHGIAPSVIGAFGGLSALMGVGATFISANLVRKLGILKAGAAGLILQSLLLTIAVAVCWSGSISMPGPLHLFLSLIVLSRLGHMSYSIASIQILQTGVPAAKANLVGITEMSIASLAELVMLAVAIIAANVRHFGSLALLSVSSVIAATWIFCRWLANPTEEQRSLFAFDPQL